MGCSLLVAVFGGCSSVSTSDTGRRWIETLRLVKVADGFTVTSRTIRDCTREHDPAARGFGRDEERGSASNRAELELRTADGARVTIDAVESAFRSAGLADGFEVVESSSSDPDLRTVEMVRRPDPDAPRPAPPGLSEEPEQMSAVLVWRDVERPTTAAITVASTCP